jgi:uracil-DNA glycosylase family 4
MTHFVMPSGPCPAKIMIVGENPGQEEVRQNMPFVGTAGREMDRMLQEAGIARSLCFVTNVAREVPPGGNASAWIAEKKKDRTPQHQDFHGKPVLKPLLDGIQLLTQEINLCQPNIIIAFGNVSLWALTGEWGVMKWRGSLLECKLPHSLGRAVKVIPVVHPGTILRRWDWRPIAIHDLRRCKKESQSAEITRVNYNFLTRVSFPHTIAVLNELLLQVEREPTWLACDIETRAGHIACLGFAWNKTDAICIPFMCIERAEGYFTENEEFTVILLLRKLLTHPNAKIIGQNFHYDAQYIYRHWMFIPSCAQDTMISQHSCFSNMQKALDFLSSMYCENHVYWKDEGKEWTTDMNEDQLWLYNCMDCVRTFEVAEVLRANVVKMGLSKVDEFQQSLFRPVLETMIAGLRVDKARRSAFAMELMDEIAKREQFFIDILDHPLNPRSNPQMQKLFYEDLKQRPVKNRKTGAISCDDEALRKVVEREPVLKPLINRITEYRSLNVFLSTFVSAPLDVDERIRCNFSITGTETYRFASRKNAFGSGLNLQNIPKGGDEGSGLQLPNVRSLFIPDPGHSFFDIDLASADLRIVVWEADEPEMKAMLRQGLDPYTEVAKEFYHDPSITKKDPRRQLFKSFCHGTNYLGTAKGLAGRLGLSVYESEKTQAWYFGRFPKIKEWQNNLKESVIKRRMVENIFGYRCYFFDRIEGTIFNQAAAWIPQSTVACIINRGYRNIFDNLKEVQVLLQVHDSLAGQFPTHLGDWATRRIIEECSVELPYADPLVVPVGIKTSPKSWGEC